MSDIELAIEIALKGHAGQEDKAGMPYILHPLAVANKVKSVDEKIVAILHDVLEDTDITEDTLRERFGGEIVDAIVALTRKRRESYKKFVMRVSENKLATAVKIADMEHNMDLSRLPKITEADRDRFLKYFKWSNFLKSVYIDENF